MSARRFWSSNTMWRVLKWLRWTVLGLLLLVILLLALVSGIVATEPGTRWALNQAAQRLPLELGEVQGNMITGLDISELEYPLEDQHYRVEGLSFRWQPLALLYSTVSVQSLSARSIEIQLPPPEEGAPEAETDEPIEWPDISLPVRIELDEVNLRDIVVRRGETETEVYAIRGSLSLGGSNLRIWELEVEGPQYEASTSGQISLSHPYPSELKLRWRYEIADLGGAPMSFSGQGNLAGDLNSVNLKHRLRQPVELQTELRFWPNLNDPEATPKLVTDNSWPEQKLPPALLPESLPSITTAGRLQLEGWLEAYHLELSGDVAAEGLPRVDFDLTGDGDLEQMALESLRLTLPEGEVTTQGNVQWAPDIRWDLGLELANFNPAALPLDFLAGWPGDISGQLHSEGALEEQGPRVVVEELALEGQLRDLALSADGNVTYEGERLLARDLSLSLGANRLTLNGTVAETFDLQANLEAPILEQVDPSLSGSLNARLDVSGSRERPSGQVHMEASNLSWQDYGVDQLTLDLAQGQDGDYSLSLESSNWALAGQTLDRFYLDGDGTLEQHAVAAELDAGALGEAEWALTGGYIDAAWRGDITELLLQPPDPLHWALREDAPLLLSSEKISLANLCLAPESRWRRARAEREALENEENRSEDNASASESPPRENLADRRPGSWDGRARGEQGSGEICLEGQWQAEAGAQAQANLKGLPLRLARRFLQPEAQLMGTLEGAVDFELSPQDGPTAQLHLETRDGAIHYQYGEEDVEIYPWETATVDADWNSEGVTGEFFTRWENFGQATATFGLTPSTGELEGQLEARFSQLSPLEAMIPRLHEVEGELTANMELLGTLKKPELRGDIVLSEGTAKLPELGLHLQNVSMTARAAADRIDVEGEVSSDPGKLTLSGEITNPWGAKREVSARLSGEEFLVMNTKELLVQVSPDLTLEANSERLILEGEARIPKALAQFERLPESATQVSNDVVFRDPEGEDERLAGMEIRTDLTLILGDDVRFIGFGLESRLSGQLRVIQNPQRGLLTVGEVGVAEGKYEAYGQDLDIERGRLIFQGPYENPGLDIRATREADDLDVIAGLEIGGTLRRPSSRVFSEPSLPDSEAMAILLTGAPLSSGSSADASMLINAVGSLGLERSGFITAEIADTFSLDEFRIQAEDEITESELHIGKYLTPRLFVRYVVGLFDQTNRVGMRYELTEELRLEAESGEHQSVDMIYKFER